MEACKSRLPFFTHSYRRLGTKEVFGVLPVFLSHMFAEFFEVPKMLIKAMFTQK